MQLTILFGAVGSIGRRMYSLVAVDEEKFGCHSAWVTAVLFHIGMYNIMLFSVSC